MPTINELMVRLDATTESLRREMRSAGAVVSSETQKMQRSLSAVDQRFEQWGRNIRATVLAAFGTRAVIDFGREVINTAVAIDQINARLRVAAGSAAGEQFEFVRREANRLGLELLSTGDAYSRFTTAASLSGMSAADTRKTFTGVAEAVTVMGLSAEQAQRIFIALQQMMSKGKVTAEDMTQQLGESLPGSLALASSALGVTTAEFIQMMSKGQILAADLLPKLGDEFHRVFGPEVAERAQSLQAQLNRLTNTVTEFELAVSQGAVPGLLELIGLLTATDEKGRSAGEAIGNVLGGAFRGMAYAVLYAVTAVNNLLDVLDRLLNWVTAHSADILSFLATLPGVGAALAAANQLGIVEGQNRQEAAIGQVAAGGFRFTGQPRRPNATPVLAAGGEGLKFGAASAGAMVADDGSSITGFGPGGEAFAGFYQPRGTQTTPVAAGAGGKGAKGTADRYADQLADLKAQVAAVNDLTAAYGHGQAAVIAAESAQRIASQTAHLARQYTEEQTTALTEQIVALEAAQRAQQNRETLFRVDTDLRRQTESLNLQLRLLGATNEQRLIENQLLEMKNSLLDAGVVNAEAEAEARRGEITHLVHLQALATELQDIARGVGQVLNEGLRDAIFSGESLNETLGNVLNKLADIVFQSTTSGLFDLISGGIGDLLKGFGLGGGGAQPTALVPQLAGGGPVSAGSLYQVNDGSGVELFMPSTPGRIVPASQRGGSAAGASYFIDARGAAPGVERRIEEVMERLTAVDRSIEPRSLAATARARARGGNYADTFQR